MRSSGNQDSWACANERIHVVRLPPVPQPRRVPRVRSLCALATPPNRSACKWVGRMLTGSLYDTPKYILDSIYISRIFKRCYAGPHEATLHLIPYPVGDLFAGDVSYEERVAYDTKVKQTLRGTAAWRRCGGCDHLLVTSRAWTDLLCSFGGHPTSLASRIPSGGAS